MGLKFEPRKSAALSKKLRALTPATDRALLAALDVAGARIARSAKRRAPRRTGDLKKSIKHEVDARDKSVKVETDLYYSHFVEFGTANGAPAQPYLYPAFKASRRRNEKEVARAISGAVKKVARK